MSTSAEPNPKQSELSSQSNQAMPTELTIDKVTSWKTNHLFDWIQQNLKNPLDDDDKKAFFISKIDGEAFLGLASDRESFRSVGLSLGASQKLAQLAKKLVELVNDPIYEKCKDCCLHCTLHATAS